MQRLLHGYWRSSAAYRVRIALNLKGLDYQQRSVHLVKDGGQQYQSDYSRLNPQQLVPFYQEIENGEALIGIGQSQAIIDYLEQRYPQTPLLPKSLSVRAKVLSLAQVIACEVHPLNNLRVLTYLQQTLNLPDEAKVNWYHHWIGKGFAAIEAQLPALLGNQVFSMGDQPGYLEAFLVPQIYNAQRFNCPLSDYPILMLLHEQAEKHQAFIDAHPTNQPDAQV